MTDGKIPEGHLHDGGLPHTSVALEGSLVLSGNRVGVQVGTHEVLYLDALLRGMVGKDVEIRIAEKVK